MAALWYADFQHLKDAISMVQIARRLIRKTHVRQLDYPLSYSVIAALDAARRHCQEAEAEIRIALDIFDKEQEKIRKELYAQVPEDV